MTRRALIPFAGLIVPVLVAAGCGSSGSSSGGTASAAVVTSSKTAALAVRTTSLGRVLVDSQGRTLYEFGHDLTNRSRCSGQCAMNWPPASSSASPKAGAGITKSRLRVIHRAGGVRQMSYNGHPLYRFVLDTRAGDVKGQGVNAFGGIWHVLSPSGAIVTGKPAKASPAPAPAPSGGGYGGY